MARLLRVDFSVDGVAESAVDLGGVTREWASVALSEFIEEKALESADGNNVLHVSHRSVYSSWGGYDSNDAMRALDALLGFHLLSGIRINATLCSAVYKFLTGHATDVGLGDLAEFDPQYARGLLSTLDCTDSEILGDLNFAYSTNDHGVEQTAELIENGTELAVSRSNVGMYVDLMLRRKLHADEHSPFLRLLSQGFSSMVPLEWLRSVQPHELKQMLESQEHVRVQDLRAAMKYVGCTEATPVIVWFWEVLEELQEREITELLRFITGSASVPSGGVQNYHPPISISLYEHSTEHVPQAHTCFNVLDLFAYSSKGMLRSKLRIALANSKGFGLG